MHSGRIEEETTHDVFPSASLHHPTITKSGPTMRSTIALLLVSLARLSQLATTAALPYNIQPTFQADFSEDTIDDSSHVTTLYVPAAPLNWDATDVAHLRPSKDGFLYFTLDGSSGESESGCRS